MQNAICAIWAICCAYSFIYPVHFVTFHLRTKNDYPIKSLKANRYYELPWKQKRVIAISLVIHTY